jgi:chromosome segregation ATPase
MELQEKFKESEKQLLEKVKQAEGKAKDSMVTIKTLEEQLLALENKYSSVDTIQTEAIRLREQEKELQARVESLQKELEQIATRNAELESREKEISVQLAIANQAIQAHNATVDGLNREMEQLQAEKQSHLEEMASLKKSKLEEEQSGHLEKIVELEKTVDNLNKQIKDNASQKLRNVDLEKQNKELRWQIKMLGISVANKPGERDDKAEQGGSLAKSMAPTTKSQPAKISVARIFGAILSQKRNIVIFYIVILHCLVYYLSTRCAS